MQVAGIKDVSPEVYEFRVYVCPVGKVWSAEVCETVADGYNFFLKVEGDAEGNVSARVGRQCRGNKSTVEGALLWAVSSSRSSVKLPLHSGVASDLRKYTQNNSFLFLKLVIPVLYKESNDFLTRNVHVPGCTLGSDLRALFMSKQNADIRMSCSDGVTVDFHSSIVGARNTEVKEKLKNWLGRDEVGLRSVKTGFTSGQLTAWLKYLYCGELPSYLSLDIELHLLCAGHQCNIKHLTCLIEQRLALRLSAHNVLRIYYSMLLYSESCAQLAQVIDRFMDIRINKFLTVKHLPYSEVFHWTLTTYDIDCIANFLLQYKLIGRGLKILRKCVREKKSVGMNENETRYITNLTKVISCVELMK